MAVVGVVAEYNPLHRGHLRHLALTREAAGADSTVVVCMSGNWVQRGECAVTDKWTRARQACEHGADLVLELPTVFAVSSAETFARAAVAILKAAGITHLSFGCESGEVETLWTLAAALSSPAFDVAVRPFLAAGLSYPAARQKALEVLVGREAAGAVAGPNNNLAVEYLRALPVDITPIAIQRTGAHDGPLEGDYPSASALRGLLLEGDINRANDHLAEPWAGEVHDFRQLEIAILCKLRCMEPEELEAIPDGGDGLAQRLWKASREAGSLEELYELSKTKRFTHARIRRVVLWAGLGLTLADRPRTPKYLRVLAMTKRGAEHLGALKDRCTLPIITKSADYKDLLEREARLTDLYALCAPSRRPCGEEWRRSPAVV